VSPATQVELGITNISKVKSNNQSWKRKAVAISRCSLVEVAVFEARSFWTQGDPCWLITSLSYCRCVVKRHHL